MEHLTNLDAIGWPQAIAGLAALAVLAVVVWLAIRLTTATYRTVKHAGMRRVAVTIAATIGLGASIESSWIFAGTILHWSGVWQAIPAVLFETALIAIATCVMEELEESDGKPETYLPWFWGLVALASTTMALAGTNAASVIGRAAIPIVPSIIWYATVVLPKLRRHRDEHERQTVTWLLSFRRIGIWLRLIKPGDDDLKQLPREYLTRRIVKAAFRAARLRRYTDTKIVGWVAAIRLGRTEVRAQRLAMLADEQIMTEAENRIERSLNAAARLDPANIAQRRKRQQVAEAEALRQQLTEARQHAASVAADLAATEAARKQEAEAAADAAEEARQQLAEALAVAAEEAAARVAAETEAAQVRTRNGSIGSSRPVAPRRLPTAARRNHGSTPRVAAETVERVAAERDRNPGLTNAQIAAALGISEKQVGNAKAVLRKQEADGSNIRSIRAGREPADEEHPQRVGA